ncbi:MAG TPA: hypothetical protein VF791_11900 [Pyrinomonadaceae bacterium]
MKKRLGLVAVICLLCGLAAGGFAVWSYFQSRAAERLGPGLQNESLRLENQSDLVKGTPEQKILLEESARQQRAAEEALADAKRHSRLALFSGIGSIILLLAGIATIIIKLKNRDVDSS